MISAFEAGSNPEKTGVGIYKSWSNMDLILALYHTAGRTSEVLNLTWEDINFEQRWVGSTI
jgi:integrase